MDRDATSFASPSHGNTNSYGYEVFLNHRGPDVKKTLASLKEHGIKVFLDQKELQEGEDITEQIEEAIRTASVHVAIFSPKYAESSWCLNELLLMLESGSTIIPVFYKVKPSDLRWARGGDGVYARSLGVLEKKRTRDSQPRYDSNTIKKWRDALSEVAGISGFELKAFNGDEGELVDKVVQQVLKKVPKPPLLFLGSFEKSSQKFAKYPQHSRELFCSHAFGQPHPAVGFEEVVERFLDAYNGLPLSLKVLGALFRGNDDLEYRDVSINFFVAMRI